MKQLDALKIKNIKRMKKNLLMNLKYNNSSERKTDEFSKSESKLINNDIVISKKNEKHPPPKKMEINLYNKKINEKKSSEKNNIKIKTDVPNSNKKEKKLSEQDIKRIKEILAYNDKELNELDYKLALKHDKRKMINIYFSFLKTDHILIKILNSKDYNSRFIKIFLFFYNFSLSYTVNALFFNEDTIH